MCLHGLELQRPSLFGLNSCDFLTNCQRSADLFPQTRPICSKDLQSSTLKSISVDSDYIGSVSRKRGPLSVRQIKHLQVNISINMSYVSHYGFGTYRDGQVNIIIVIKG